MVKIAIAGGSGGIGQEIIDVLVATKKHEVILLSRKSAPAESASQATTWVKTDYSSVDDLAQILQGVHTVLSFVTEQEDPTSPVQKKLIDASVKAGVKRFAPSEWASNGLAHMSWYGFKETTRQYLKDLNKDKKVLEYTLFQPGYLLNYLTRPYPSAKYIPFVDLPWDFNNRRWFSVDEGQNSTLTLTTIADLTNVVAQAIEFEGEWPVVGGIKGNDITMGELLTLAEKVRGGKPFAIEHVKAQDLEAGTWEASWTPVVDHASIPPEQRAGLARWNRLLPDYQFTDIDDFLTEAWKGKP